MTVEQVIDELFRRGHYMAENHGQCSGEDEHGRFEFTYLIEDLRIIYVKLPPIVRTKYLNDVDEFLEYWIGRWPAAKAHRIDGKWVEQVSWSNPHHIPQALCLLRNVMVLDDLAGVVP